MLFSFGSVVNFSFSARRRSSFPQAIQSSFSSPFVPAASARAGAIATSVMAPPKVPVEEGFSSPPPGPPRLASRP